jgi:hypothetical protein
MIAWAEFSSPDPLQLRFRNLMRQISKQRCTFHGLRRNATNRLAGLGLTPHDIGAITGMTLETIDHYSRDINARLLWPRARKRNSA